MNTEANAVIANRPAWPRKLRWSMWAMGIGFALGVAARLTAPATGPLPTLVLILMGASAIAWITFAVWYVQGMIQGVRSKWGKRTAALGLLLLAARAKALGMLGAIAAGLVAIAVFVAFVAIITPLLERLDRDRNVPPPANPPVWAPPVTNAPPPVAEPPPISEPGDPLQQPQEDNTTELYDRYEAGKGVVARSVPVPTWVFTRKK